MVVVVAGDDDRVDIGKLFQVNRLLVGVALADKRKGSSHRTEHGIEQDALAFHFHQESRLAVPGNGGQRVGQQLSALRKFHRYGTGGANMLNGQEITDYLCCISISMF